ncbi:MAG TPA: hypothetical protein VMH28_29330 [Candidatus Acidoferrales bacterium]|nr:hypothetical protein [Candidatus Acidoferrales bacterium]
MKDWKSIAHAHGLDVSARDLDRIEGPLNALEETFRPLADQLPPDLEPDTELRLDAEER